MTPLERSLLYQTIDTPAFRLAYNAWAQQHPGKTPADMLRALAEALDSVAPNASPA